MISNLYGMKVVVPTCLAAVILSCMTGWFVERQASPNYDRHEDLEAALQSAEKLAGCVPEALVPIGEGLSSFNRKIINSRVLERYSSEEQARIQHAELRELLPDVIRLARTPLASFRAGRVVAVVVGAVSFVLWFNVSWLCLTGCRYLPIWRMGGAGNE